MSIASIQHDVGGPSVCSVTHPVWSHGAMSAYAFAHSRTGRLPMAWVDVYRSDRENPGILRCVFLRNPIAWIRADGEVVIPDIGYSLTTTRHQGMCRAGLGRPQCALVERTTVDTSASGKENDNASSLRRILPRWAGMLLR